MAAQQRLAGGLSCADVLERLSEFLDDALSERQRSQVHEHLAACDWCERFGADFSSMVDALRASLCKPLPVSSAVVARLAKKLEEET